MIVGVSLVKDEADVIERTVRHMATQVDHMIVADNGSTDGTRDILADLAYELPLTVRDDAETAHFQARKLTALAARAAEIGATWVVPFDADELVESPNGRLGDVLRSYRRAWIFTAQLLEYRPTDLDPDTADPFARIGWRRRDPNMLLKIACRPHPDLRIAEGSHTCDYDGNYPRTVAGEIITRHFPYRSPQQFVSKIRNGARGRNATDLSPDIGNHLRAFGRILDEHGPAELERIYREEFVVREPESDPSMVFDHLERFQHGGTVPAGPGKGLLHPGEVLLP